MTLQSFFNTSKMSVYHEKMIEHVFIAELAQALGRRHKKVDCLASRSGDLFGYDFVLLCDGVSKYVQMKTRVGKTDSWKVNKQLVNQYPQEFELIVVDISYDSTGNKLNNLKYKIIERSKKISPELISSGEKIKENKLDIQIYDIDSLSSILFP
ncbi:hypothetical protein PTI45_02578 [Paenibacillus nuruki]|uniref:Protein NO VEIN C-terminal domain-containing protein n=1 Tax=Paenibacillus nuruki TaxID=1886670 RepID=A0A1E3L5D0_9BACL|nr:hypothetical protein [Paenibacillus nuruki]ODP28160.1 hypothetical protein PTI45_02578 [Paenibacillus nuruki]